MVITADYSNPDINIYADTVVSDDYSVCELHNITLAQQALSRAKDDDESFFFVSRDIVFDMSADVTYVEGMIPQPTCIAGKTLRATEKAVLSYHKGFILRLPTLSPEIQALAVRIANSPPPESIRDVPISFMMENIADLAVETIANKEGDIPRVIHVALHCNIDLARLVFAMYPEHGFITALDGEDYGLPFRRGLFGTKKMHSVFDNFDTILAFSKDNSLRYIDKVLPKELESK
jgi:dTDP-4-dehydrorhamnose reductase